MTLPNEQLNSLLETKKFLTTLQLAEFKRPLRCKIFHFWAPTVERKHYMECTWCRSAWSKKFTRKKLVNEVRRLLHHYPFDEHLKERYHDVCEHLDMRERCQHCKRLEKFGE